MSLDPQSFVSGLIAGGTAFSVIGFLRSRPRPAPPVRVNLYVGATVTCSCGQEETTRIPYQPGMSEFAVTCSGCDETTWLPVPAEVGQFLTW